MKDLCNKKGGFCLNLSLLFPYGKPQPSRTAFSKAKKRSISAVPPLLIISAMKCCGKLQDA